MNDRIHAPAGLAAEGLVGEIAIKILNLISRPVPGPLMPRNPNSRTCGEQLIDKFAANKPSTTCNQYAFLEEVRVAHVSYFLFKQNGSSTEPSTSGSC